MKRTAAPKAGARKTIFRATAGLTVEQQLQVASQLQAEGDDVLKAIMHMKKTSKNQKQATKATNLKFEWLQELTHLRKLEENCSRELESLLLRMYNDASTAREFKKVASQSTPSKNEANTPRSAQDKHSSDESNDFEINQDDGNNEFLTRTTHAEDLEELIRTEQLNRVALIKQISSEREQREALKQLLHAVSSDIPEDNNQLPAEEMLSNVRMLVYDAIIGRQMIEATLEEEVQKCEQDFQSSYRAVLAVMKEGHKGGVDGNKFKNVDVQEQKIAAMVEAAGGSKCPDELLLIEIAEDFRNCFVGLRDDLAEYEQEFIAAASNADAAGVVEAATDKCGGWRESDEERFLKIFQSYERKHGAGNKPQILYDQLALVLPQVPLSKIKQHVKFHQHRHFHQQKCKDRQREFQRKLKELQVDAEVKICQAIDQEQERIRRIEQVSEMQQQCEVRHDRVAKWRESKEAKERIEQQQREIEQMLEDQKNEEAELRWKRKQEQQKLAVDDYKKGKIIEKMATEKIAMEEEQQREAERDLQSVVNAERVQYRHHEFQRKLEEEKAEKLHKAQLEEQRLSKLNELKEKTPYAQIIANIKPDPERTRQETVAFRANVEGAQEGLQISETGLFPSHGYDCETLFKNARFKLGIALRDAGLNSSEYARQALANVKVCNVGAYRNHVAEPTHLW